jgi:hypothetical protein
MAALVESLDARVTAVEVTALRDGAFLAKLVVSGPSGERRLDARPSDGIALAVRSGAPLYAAEDVLGEAGTVLADQPDEEAVDRAVAEFRGYLDRLDPAALSAALGEQPEVPGIESDETEPDGNDEAPPHADPGRGDRG